MRRYQPLALAVRVSLDSHSWQNGLFACVYSGFVVILRPQKSTKIVLGFFIILLFLVLGNVVSWAIGGIIPGSVIGMLLLFICLCLKWIRPCHIRTAAELLTHNMSFFFVPAMVGIMEQWDVIRLNIAGWLGILVLTTVAIMVSSGLTMQGLARLQGRFKKKGLQHA